MPISWDMVKRRKIHEEIQQSKPFGSLIEEAGLALWRTADVVRDRMAAVVEPAGVTVQQYNVLRILRGAGPDGLHTLAVAERMIERAPGITRMIDRLEAKGLVSRSRLDNDRRCVVCRISNRGLELLTELDQPVAAAHASVLGALDPADAGQLIEFLDAIRTAG
ncbi:MAG: MarR family transcriptional regulator [Gemmatimonadota bacterium]